MYEMGDHSNSGESGRGESDTQISNIFDYVNGRISNPLNGVSNEHPFKINNESDIYSVEQEICSTRLDNIHEEEIVMEKMVEYIVPATVNYKFSEMFNTPKDEFGIRKSYIVKPPDLSPDIVCSRSFHNKMNTDEGRRLPLGANVSGNNLKPVRSKSLTYLDYASPKRLKNRPVSEPREQRSRQESGQTYSNAFLNNEKTLQELKQQNMLAQKLLTKYFKKDEPLAKMEPQPEPTNMKNPEKKKMDTVSSLMKRYFNHADESEQVCIKPSDGYVFLNTKGASKKSLGKREASVKFVRPFKYHKKYWDSGSNVDVVSKAQSHFKCEGPGRKRSRLEFESNVALKQDSSTDMSLKTQNVQFLTTGGKQKASDAEANKVLFKTDSKNFENSYSYEELQTFMPERYMTLRNLYGYKYIEDTQEKSRIEQSKPRYNFQTLPNENSKSRELVVKFFDSGSHVKVTDDDYKRWLKEKDFLKYTDFAKSSVSSITFRSISQKIVNYSIGASSKPNREKNRSRSNLANKNNRIHKFANTRTIPSLTTSMENCNFVDIEYNNLYQLVIYEHIVISNLINFYCSFHATRIRKLTIVDRTYQLMFVIFCYYILSLINNSIFTPFDENWF